MLTRTNPFGWGINEAFLSAQANGMDIMITNAVDKRAGGLEVDSQDVTVHVPLVGMPRDAGASQWSFWPSGIWATWTEFDVTSLIGVRFLLTPRAKGVLKNVRIHMYGAIDGVAHGGFPGTMPSFTLSYQPRNTNVQVMQTVTAVKTGNFGDGPTNFSNVIGNYDGEWDVLLSNGGAGFGDQSHAQSRNLFIQVQGERGANAANGKLAITDIEATWTMTGLTGPS